MFVLSFLLRRLAQGLVIIFLVAFVIFALLRVVPGDPVRLIVGGMAPDTLIEEIAQEMGLRDPIVVQFGRYLEGVLQGDLGNSFVRPASGASLGGTGFADVTRAERAEVLGLILEHLPLTLQLAGLAMVFALVIAVPLGIAGGLYPGRWPDRLALYLGSLFISLPNFWLAIMLILLVSVQLRLLPAIGYQGFSYALLPAFVLAIEIAPFIIRALTVSMAQVMQEGFVEAGLVRGLRRSRIIFVHALRNAAVPVLNLLGIQFSTLLGGVLVIEFIFDYPGLGRLTINAVLQRDFPLIQGIAILTCGFFVLINILVDLASTAIDPRLEY